MPRIAPPDSKALPLLRVIVEAIRSGRIREDESRTFLSYSEALDLTIGLSSTRNCRRLRRWIVEKKTHRPSRGFPEAHGIRADDPSWQIWWMKEANRAIRHDWARYLPGTVVANESAAKTGK